MTMEKVITSAHGSGGLGTSSLIENIFAKYFNNEYLAQMEDATIVPGGKRLAVTTDSFVVEPYIFPGGDIGKLSVCGTVNDLLVRGAVPKYLTCGFILCNGLKTDDLEMIVKSMASAAEEAGVKIVAGDTKVVPGDGGLYINTTGVGVFEDEEFGADRVAEGDVIIVSGNLGDHHVAILKTRMGIENNVMSDVAVLKDMIENMRSEGVCIKAMRDITRGGLATILAELSKASEYVIEIDEEAVPVSSEVAGFSDLLGLDPLYMGNEGKLVAVVAKEDAEKALECIKRSKYGENAAIIGKICEREDEKHGLYINTHIGGRVKKDVLVGEGLPRIC